MGSSVACPAMGAWLLAWARKLSRFSFLVAKQEETQVISPHSQGQTRQCERSGEQEKLKAGVEDGGSGRGLRKVCIPQR